jgi:hypothetical protein
MACQANAEGHREAQVHAAEPQWGGTSQGRTMCRARPEVVEWALDS